MMKGINQQSVITLLRIPENSVGVELGVWKGESSEIFLEKASMMYLVDSWSIEPYGQSKEHGDFKGYLKKYQKLVGSNKVEDFQKYYDGIYEQIREKFANKNVKIYRMSTNDFFKAFSELVDWVYVDAAHDHEGCYSDLKNCLKIIKPGGKILGDDYHNKPGVKSAVNQFVEENRLYLDNFYKNQYEIILKS